MRTTGCCASSAWKRKTVAEHSVPTRAAGPTEFFHHGPYGLQPAWGRTSLVGHQSISAWPQAEEEFSRSDSVCPETCADSSADALVSETPSPTQFTGNAFSTANAISHLPGSHGIHGSQPSLPPTSQASNRSSLRSIQELQKKQGKSFYSLSTSWGCNGNSQGCELDFLCRMSCLQSGDPFAGAVAKAQ